MLIHIGYHKTGTTFLQTGLFDSSQSAFASPWSQHEIRQRIVLCPEFDWDPSAVRELFRSGLEAATAEGLVPVMSDERLSGSPHAGGFDSARTACRLAEVFPDARVLIGIREQAGAIYSTYQQYVRNGGSARIDKYFRPRHPAEAPGFRFEHWEYHHLIGLYQDLFSRDRVLVLPYEQLAGGDQPWIDQICSFVGLPSVSAVEGNRYPSLSATGIAVKRHANRFLFRGGLNPGAPFYVKDLEERFERLESLWPRRLSARISRRYRGLVASETSGKYAKSNRVTASLTGLDLNSLGYEVEDE